MSDRPYLFPVPAAVLRRGLNLRAQLGEKFSDDDAAADVMLDLDAVEGGRRRGRDGTGLPHAYSYYAKRWGWGKGTVTRAFVGDDARGVEPWLRERADAWRTFFSADRGTARDRSGTARDQESGQTGANGHIGDRGGTARDRSGTGIDQTPRPPEGAGGARAREALAALGFDDPALVAEAEDSASSEPGALVGDELARAALCLGTTGVLPHKARDVLDGLDPPARAALLVAVLRTGQSPRTGPRTNYLLSLARSLDDHARSARYASQSGSPNGTPADGAPRGAAEHGRGASGRIATGRNARERANQLSARDLESSARNSLAILRARRDQGGDAAGDGPPGG